MLFECECGVRIDCKPPLYCKCGRVHGLNHDHYRPTVCRHRSEPLGKASCGCGLVYECRLLGKLCGDSQPLEFANFGKVILDATTYQRCGGCAEFSLPSSRQ